MRDINTFKRQAKYKLIVMYLAILVPIILVTVLESVFENLKVDSIIYRYVAFGLVEAWIIYKIVIYHLIIAKEDYAETLLTKISDERNIFIKMKALNLSYKIMFFINGVALIAAGFFSDIIFYVILCELLVLIGCYYVLKVYFNKKF